MTVHALSANQPPARFYRGGAQISAFRGLPTAATHEPEDWVGSVTTVAGHDLLGATRLPDGRLLVDAIRAEPERWLGAAHVARFGADPMMLAKLLDAGQRLPVHAHPTRAFARDHLGHRHGKAEAWHILSGGEVYLGLRERVSSDRLRALVDAQRVDDLVDLLHRFPVSAGDTVFVPPGYLHAIGEGVFLAEIQEPEDLSILLEWRDFDLDGARDGHLGLGFDVALDAVALDPVSDEQLSGLVHRSGRDRLLPESAAPFFRLERRPVTGGRVLEPGFAIVVVVAGRGHLRRGAASYPVERGQTLLLEHAGGPVEVAGDLELLEMRPPTS